MKNSFKIILILAFHIFINTILFSQTQISGIINQYTTVDSITPSGNTLIVGNASLFNEGDTVLIIQMKGAIVKTSVDISEENFGYYDESNIKKIGKYEFIIIKNVISAESKIILNVPLDRIYSTKDNVQLVRVPSYSSAVVSNTLTCTPWNDSIGGVLAFFVADTISLNANIDVTGKGFRGAGPVLSEGACAGSDSLLYRSFYFSESFNGAGRKGEGIAKNDTLYAKGLGAWSNAGGGGNARFSGGGGGAGTGGSLAVGGIGGAEDSICITPKYFGEMRPYYPFYDTLDWPGIGGRGGQPIYKNDILDTIIYLGGGGGSGTYIGGLTASKGGNGGGIVIILSNYVKPNGFKIIANGGSVSDTATASGGGGGGGGVILIDIETVKSNLGILAKGGNGGKTIGPIVSGPGGGGGGGIFLNGGPNNPLFSVQTSGGSAGYLTDEPPTVYYYAFPGGAGTNSNNIKIPLTGFLFNTILENQKVCMGNVPNLISGSTPKGGDGNYEYEWQHKTNHSIWSTIADSTRRDYQPAAMFDTTYIRRIVSSAGVIDTSRSIVIDIHSNIIGNNIWGNDTICIDNPADTLYGTTVYIGGDGSGFDYTWESSTDYNSWEQITPENDTVCWGGIIIDTTYYRRRVESGACYTYSEAKIVGLPKIIKNTLPLNQEICFGQIPDPVIGDSPENGLGIGSYQYSWEESSNGTDWALVTDSTRKDLIPSNLIETVYYRRIVNSGDCMDYSESHKINVLPSIESYEISNSSIIYTCYNTPPENLIGLTPTGGDGTYRYQWQESADASIWSGIAENSDSKDYQPLALIDTTYYWRIVSSGINDCCKDTSNFLRVNIRLLPIGLVSDLDTTICSNEAIDLNVSITSGSMPYSLYYSDGFQEYSKTGISVNDTTIIVYPETNLQKKVFNYVIDSITDKYNCFATDIQGLSSVLAYGWPESNAGENVDNCDTIIILNATPSLGKGFWSYLNGTGIASFDNDTLYNTSMVIDVSGNYTIKWKETNWECSDSSTIDVLMYRKPINVNAGNDTTLFNSDEFELVGSYINPDEIKKSSSFWDIASGPGVLSNTSELNSIISELYENYGTSIDVLWTISKEGCEDIIDSVIITLEPIFTPTGFSPNGDGINDFFKIKGIEIGVTNELIIYNRWGTEVYRKKNYSNDSPWDGKNMSGNSLPEETYFYIFTMTDIYNKNHTRKGFVVLKGQGND